MKLTFAFAFISTVVLGVTAASEAEGSNLQVRAIIQFTNYLLTESYL